MHPALRLALAEARRAAPFALLLAVALGTVLVVGANLSNAFPSEKAPYGWPGPSSFENGVAMVRSDLVLATTLPALLMGALALRERGGLRAGELPIVFGTHAALLVLAVTFAMIAGAIGAADTRPVAYTSFTVAHALLAMSFYSLAFLCASVARRWAVPVALAVWLGFNAAYEGITRIVLFRQEGYDNLSAGNFPDWFFLAQALSPLSAYRGVLILWDRKFMDYFEQAALGQAALPAWLNPATFIVFTLLFWIALPLGLATFVWWFRAKASAGSARARREEPA